MVLTELELNRIDSSCYNTAEFIIVQELMKYSLLYSSALKEVQTKVEILRDDFKQSNAYNPIEHIKTRIKSPTSILKKAYMRNLDLNANAIKDGLNDIAGIRIVCTFKSDIHKIADIIMGSENICVLQIKDYVTNPKESGYQSYHIIVEVPVYLITGTQYCKVEIQLRTMAMDFWASLEHKIKYKYDWIVPQEIKDELFECSTIVDSLDDKMLKLHTKVHNPNEFQIEPNL